MFLSQIGWGVRSANGRNMHSQNVTPCQSLSLPPPSSIVRCRTKKCHLRIFPPLYSIRYQFRYNNNPNVYWYIDDECRMLCRQFLINCAFNWMKIVWVKNLYSHSRDDGCGRRQFTFEIAIYAHKLYCISRRNWTRKNDARLKVCSGSHTKAPKIAVFGERNQWFECDSVWAL